MLNGVTKLIMMKSDVLSGFSKIKVCTGYKTDQGVIVFSPYDLSIVWEPIYKEFDGWMKIFIC
jgi:adenylosuccinate synthase